MPIKKRSHKGWRGLIRAELKGKGRNRHCSATCPHLPNQLRCWSSQ